MIFCWLNWLSLFFHLSFDFCCAFELEKDLKTYFNAYEYELIVPYVVSRRFVL